MTTRTVFSTAAALVLSAHSYAAEGITPEFWQRWTAALQSAQTAWGMESPDPIELRYEPINACNLHKHDKIANTHAVTTWTKIILPQENGGPDLVETSYSTRWIVSINSSCDWSKLPFEATISHEVGHILMRAGEDSPEYYHSKDPRSVMFWLVTSPTQTILPADREQLPAVDKATSK